MPDQQRRVVLASNNPHKAVEFAALLAEHLPSWEPLPRPPEVPEVIEDAPTFLGNARLKAEALVDATGDSALADDSGLVVDGLGGAPGVHSARYAGEGASDSENVAKLLEDLAAHGATEPERRTARFVCVLVLRHPDGTEVVAEGSVEGTIAMEPRGHRGFGYDPVFLPTEGFGRTFAEMSEDEKNEISHRSRALHSLIEKLRASPEG
ncbi:MAG: RdgB/HAM1 family non-canonical purine NTP pyrophosphatase [Microthrixaceae bacterium]